MVGRRPPRRRGERRRARRLRLRPRRRLARGAVEGAARLAARAAAVVGLGHRFGTPWRPMEQGLVEGSHVETQKVMGMLVKDVMQCFPNETAELLHVLEFVVYNTPGPHGLTPRDIDRRWSLASSLERELLPFEAQPWQPVSDYVSQLFRNYREIRVRVLGYQADSAETRRRSG